jgi:hypothetical protein
VSLAQHSRPAAVAAVDECHAGVFERANPPTLRGGLAVCVVGVVIKTKKRSRGSSFSYARRVY